jgi:hypothetical protein
MATAVAPEVFRSPEPVPAPVAASAPRPERTGLALERRSDGLLWMREGTRELPVWVSRCFPWSEPGRFYSLRDAEGDEVAMVADAADLDPASRAVLEQALDDAGFVFRITAVRDIEDEIEIRRWRVTTAQGERTFQTRLDEWPRATPHGGFVIRDLGGDLFELPAPDRLDRRSRKLLWAFVD